MSKYIKLDDAIHNINLEVVGRKEYTGDMKANLFFALDDLPTIEVSEEVLKATKNFNAYTIADKNAEMGMRTMIEPIIEVSEDCISRADAIKAYNEAIDELVKAEMEEFNLGDFTECSFNTTQLKLIARKIEDAPSVVPSEDCISRAEVIAEFERRKDKLYEDDYFDELMWIIENITDVVPSRAEGEWELSSDNDGEYGICSLCGNDADFTHYGKAYLYCPNCGTKMKEETL